MRRRAIFSVVGMLIAFSVGTPSPAEHKQHKPLPGVDRIVRAGGHRPGDPQASWTYTNFYPKHLKIHRGMTVAWRFEDSFAGLHTVHFEAGPDGSDGFTGDPPRSIRRDEAPGWAALNEDGWAFGSEDGRHGAPCGRLGPVPFAGKSELPPCVLEPGKTVSSGLTDNFFSAYRGKKDPRPPASMAPFGITFAGALKTGSFRYACKYHPGMEATVEIVDKNTPIPTAEQVAEEAQAEFEADTALAEAYLASRKPERKLDPEGNVVHVVKVGDQTPDGEVNFIEYFPSKLDIEPGDRIRFETHGDEWQTVTFPEQTVGGLNSLGECYTAECTGAAVPWGEFVATFPWGCELDHPEEGAPHLPIYVPMKGCPAGAHEWILGPNTMMGQPAPENMVPTRATRHNSGLMLAEDFPSWARFHPTDRWPHQFDAVFPATGTFNYTCLIHPQAMRGSIEVS